MHTPTIIGGITATLTATLIAAPATAHAATPRPVIPKGCESRVIYDRQGRPDAAYCGTQMNATTLIQVVKAGGWPRSEWEMVLAVGNRESGDYTNTHNWNQPRPGKGVGCGKGRYSVDTGWLQINDQCHVKIAKKYRLSDPVQNSKAGFQIWSNAYRYARSKGKSVAQAKHYAYSTWGGYKDGAKNPNDWSRRHARSVLAQLKK